VKDLQVKTHKINYLRERFFWHLTTKAAHKASANLYFSCHDATGNYSTMPLFGIMAAVEGLPPALVCW